MFFYPDSRFCKGLNFEYAKFSRFQFLEREVTCFDKGDNSILEYLFIYKLPQIVLAQIRRFILPKS
jgi:hypothetical protein